MKAQVNVGPGLENARDAPRPGWIPYALDGSTLFVVLACYPPDAAKKRDARCGARPFREYDGPEDCRRCPNLRGPTLTGRGTAHSGSSPEAYNQGGSYPRLVRRVHAAREGYAPSGDDP